MSLYTHRNLSNGVDRTMAWIRRARFPRIKPTARLSALGVLAVAVLLGGCDALDKALDVDAPGMVDASDIYHPDNAHLLVSGTVADFECALGAYIVNGGLLGNELRDASVTAQRFPLDSRTINDASPYGVNGCNGNPPGIYRPLSTAIWTSLEALEQLNGWTDDEVEDRADLIAQAATYSGLSHTLMGEGFCSAVIEENGPEVEPAEIFATAEALFDDAIAAATSAGNDEIQNLAQLGRARVRIHRNDATGAAADAQAVLDRDPDFELVATASSSTSRRNNRVGAELWAGNITVDPSYRGLTVEGVPDPRVVAFDTDDLGHDSATPVWMVTKYGTAYSADIREVDVPVASWREARLIIAEAEGGQEAVDQINALRDHWGLPHFSSTDPDEIFEQVIEERSRELYLEGHHLGDLRRFDIPNTPAAGEAYRQGGVYGDVRCFPLPTVEKDNNPNF